MGHTYSDKDHIKDTFLDYSSKLWEDITKDSLTKDITKEEVFSALNFLEESKSPGPDGFNVEFFNFFWEDIVDPLFLAIKHFSPMLLCLNLGVKLL